MKKVLFNLLLANLIFTSCQPAWKEIFQEEKYFNVEVFVPIISEGKDSITISSSLGIFYSFQNMKLLSYKDFCYQLYRHIEKKECIEVDSILYEKLHQHNHVQVDPAMLQFYNQYGINKLLNKYGQKDDESFYFDLFNTSLDQYNLDYLLYLCSLNHIYFELGAFEEGPGLTQWYKR